MTRQPYISRKPAEELQAAFAEALEQPANNPVLFHIWGIGGVGKSTLKEKLKREYKKQADFTGVSFGLTAGIENPIKLMKKLHEQSPKPRIWQWYFWWNLWTKDSFGKLYQKYWDTVNNLETQPVQGKQSVDKDLVKKLAKTGASAIAQLMPASGITAPVAGKAAETAVDAAGLILSEKDRIQQLLQQHRATKKKRELQELMLEPLPKLTQALAEGLKQRIKQRKRPVVLIFDTYEKASAEIDTWLWQYLLANTTLQPYPVRIIVAGRRNILNSEPWRKLQQDRNLIYERHLDRFDADQTAAYLKEINITEADRLETISGFTKGLPYYLNWIRQQRTAGSSLDFSQGNQAIVNLLLQGLNDTQKKVVQLAACCRWFDKRLIKHLLQDRENLDFQTAVDEKLDCFKWLKQRDFVELVQGYHRLDDVARDVFRESLWRDDEDLFQEIHAVLANYFTKRANREVPSDSPPPEKYNNPTWRQYTAESLYHSLYSGQRDCQRQFISHLFASRYFNQDEVVENSLDAIVAEVDLTGENAQFLSYATKEFLLTVKPAVEYGKAILEEYPIDYEKLKGFELSRSQVEKTLNLCFRHLDSLSGVAKFAALLYKSKRCSEHQRLDWLIKAKEQAEQTFKEADPEFSSGIFLWDVGNTLYKLGRYSEAIASYDQALEFKPDNDQAWYNRGVALGNLGRYSEAIASYDQALQIKPDDPNPFYNKACCYALQGNIDLAIKNLQQAINLNPDEYREMAKTDSDFDSIRSDRRFPALIKAQS